MFIVIQEVCCSLSGPHLTGSDLMLYNVLDNLKLATLISRLFEVGMQLSPAWRLSGNGVQMP